MKFMTFFIILIIVLYLIWFNKKINRLTDDVNRIINNTGGLIQNTETVSGENNSIAQKFVTENSVVDQNQMMNQEKPVKQSEIDDIKRQTEMADRFFGWFKENWLLKLGVFLILIGFGWFISYAFVHNWIGPVGRVTLGFLVGTALALFGYYRMPKNTVQGKLFLILGSALVIITSYASQVVYGFFDPVVALGIVFLVSTFVSVFALQFKNKNIAVYGLVISFLAPLLTDANVGTELLFSYLAIVSLASIWLASVRGWRFINAVAIVGFSLFAIPNILDKSHLINHDFILFIVFGLGLVYFFVSIWGAIKNLEKTSTSDIVVAVLDSIIILVATMQIIPEEIQSLVLAGWMVVFAVGSYVAFSYTQKENFFYVYSLISIVLLAIITAIELEGFALIYAYAFESASISVAGYLITKKLKVGYSLSFLMIGPILMSLPSIVSRSWFDGIFHDDFAILLIMGLLSFVLGIFYYFADKEAIKYNDLFKEKVYVVFNLLGSIYGIILIWLCSGALIENQDTAVMVALVIYTIIGIISYFYGLTNNEKGFKYYGATLLILVVARLVLVDVWEMNLAERIVTFILIGVLFISTAFIGNKVRDQKHLSENIN